MPSERNGVMTLCATLSIDWSVALSTLSPWVIRSAMVLEARASFLFTDMAMEISSEPM